MKTPKLNDKYQAFGNDSRYFIITGGRGSGKSFAVNVFLLLLTYERGHKILFTRYTMVSAASSIIPEFIEKLEMMGVSEDFRITKDEITNIKTKSSILFKGIRTASGNQTASLKSLNAITTFVLDEDDFDKIDQSVRVKNKQNRCVLILNPTTKEHWIFNRFFENRHIPDGFNGIKGGITYIHTTYLDNKDNLSVSFLNQIQDIRRRRPEKYNHQIMGAWLEKQEGVIFRNWRIGEFNENYDVYYGQDFGFSIDPTVLMKLSIDKKGRRIFCKTMYCKAGLSTTQIADYNIRYAGPHLIICDSSEPRLIKEVKLKGVNIRPTVKRSGSILTGIALLQDFDLIVDPDSTELIKELNNYVWATKGQTKPVDKFNHCIDAIRYAAQYALEGFNKGSYSIR